MPRTLSLEEFDAPYTPPLAQPRTLTIEQFDAPVASPPLGFRCQVSGDRVLLSLA